MGLLAKVCLLFGSKTSTYLTKIDESFGKTPDSESSVGI